MNCIHSLGYHLGWEAGSTIQEQTLEVQTINDNFLPMSSKPYRLGFQDALHGKMYSNPWGEANENLE